MFLRNKENGLQTRSRKEALNYVDVDAPSLYDISEAEMKEFKEKIEKRWGMYSTYGKNKKN
jgi:hypothetical protein